MKNIKIFLSQMKQTIKNYLYLELVIITSFIIFSSAILFPVFYINNILFAILYLIIPCPLIIIGIYKIVLILYDKISKL